MPTETKTRVRVTLSLPEEIYDEYAERATKYGRKPEQEIELRLTRCRNHNDTTPLYFNDQQRGELQTLLGKTPESAEHALGMIKRLSTIRVDGVDIVLAERLRERLSTRLFRDTMENVVKREVIRGLEGFVGWR